MNTTNQTKKLVGTIVIAALALLMLMPFVRSMALSVVDFHPVTGILGSPAAGTEHYDALSQDPGLVRMINNTTEVVTISTVVGVAYVFLAAVAIISIKNQFVKGAVATVFALPAVVPVSMLCNIIPVRSLMESAEVTKFWMGVFSGLRVAGLFSFLAFFLRGNAIKEGTKCMLMFLAIYFAMFLASDFASAFSLQNPFNQMESETMSTIVYRRGIMGGDYSASAAVEVARSIMQLIPAAIGCLLLIFMHRKTDKQSLQAVGNYQQGYYNNQQTSVNLQQGANSNFANYSNQFPNTANLQKANQGWDPFQLFAIFAIVPIVIFFFVVSKNASLFPAVTGNPMVPRAYEIGIEVALKSAVLVSGISLGLAMLARNTYGGVGFIALMLVCVTGRNLISNYLFAWDLDFLDKINGMVFYNLQMIPMFSLMMTCATYRDRSWKKDLAVFIGGFVLLFAYFWGDYSSTLVTVTDPDLHPISYLVMRVLKESGAARQMYMQQGRQLVYEQNSTLPIIIIPVITVAAGFIGSAFLKKEKKNTIYPQ